MTPTYNRTSSALSIDYAAQIKDRLSMFDVVLRYIPNAKIHNNEILCPFHSEKTPSCHIWDDHFKCFGCGKYGDVISFVRDYFNLSFQDALAKLNCDFGLNLPLDRKPTLKEAVEAQKRWAAIVKERQAKEANFATMHSRYLTACAEFQRLRQNYIKHKPESICTELHPLFVEALQNLSYYDYLTTDLSEQLSRLENQRNDTT
jgi:DNA primase